MIKKAKKKKVVMVSGGFDPVHIGHVRMFKEAKKLGDELVVVLNNDNWLRFKKGYAFMPDKDRKEIIESFTVVDRVVLTSHKPGTADITVCKELRKIKPHIFANGGDRKENVPVPEYEVCRELGIKMVFNVGHGGKIRSSSGLLKTYAKKHPKNK
ncbi:adenylyltransferase/cytidyltransferase family protein [Candidatus Nomurabacteria bacterium]|nr:adenylyltransferase/cytidyltransferase family protein [Candidatus Nomurabacteria bacterium]